MGRLTKDDVRAIHFLQDAWVLQDIKDHRLDQSNGVILVTCGDGDQSPDILRHHRRLCRADYNHERIHLISSNGGALLLSERSPLLKPGLPSDKVILNDIEEAFILKGITTVALYAHAPCGKAGLAGVDIYKSLQLLVEAKARVKNTFPDKFKVACFFHVDFTNGVKRTYFVSRNAWLDWAKLTT